MVDLNVGENQLWQLCLQKRRGPVVQQLLQLLLVQLTGGGWSEVEERRGEREGERALHLHRMMSYVNEGVRDIHTQVCDDSYDK